MHRFFVFPGNFRADTVSLTGEDVHHATRVLRLGVGDHFIAIDPDGNEYVVEIYMSTQGRIVGRVLSKRAGLTEPVTEVTLVQGVAKGDKMDYIVQKCTEVGIKKFIPVLTERTVIRLNEEKADARRERWQKIAQEASEQSHRAHIPLVEPVMQLQDVFEKIQGQVILVSWEEEKNKSIREALKACKPGRPVTLCIGPEGGFSENEIAMFVSHGGVAVTLGPRILRTETAGVVAASLVLYEMGDLG